MRNQHINGSSSTNIDLFNTLHGYTARKIAEKVAAEWCAAGIKQKDSLDGILKTIQWVLARGPSGTKAIAQASKLLFEFFAKEGTQGNILESSSRKISFEIVLPTPIHDGLGFRVVQGELNGRSGACQVLEMLPVQVTWHALQRVLGRGDSHNNHGAFQEISGCLSIADAWSAAGNACQAQCWPVLSSNGFFVAAPNGDSNTVRATLVTWMKGGSLSRKWGVVFDNLKSVRASHPELLKSAKFAKEFIASFPWMLREHIPGPDILGAAWDSRQFDPEIETPTDHTENEEIEIDSEEVRGRSPHISTAIPADKLSATYIPGLNYQSQPPQFKSHSRHRGLVVQKRNSGALIVSLGNSWYGKIPEISNERTKQLGLQLGELAVGDEVDVEIKKIAFIESESAYSISLDQCKLVDAIWADVEHKYAVGTTVIGQIISQRDFDCSVLLDDGVRGNVSIDGVRWKFGDCVAPNETYVGRNLELVVSGFRVQQRNIQFDVHGYRLLSQTSIAEAAHLGQQVAGQVIRLAGGYVVIRLQSGVHGLLHRFNCWNRPLPEVGDAVTAIVIRIDLESEGVMLGLAPPDGVQTVYWAIPPTDASWSAFLDSHKVDDSVLVQVLSIYESNFVVATAGGIYGFLPFKEATWSTSSEDQSVAAKVGDLIEVKIIGIKNDKKKVRFSRRPLIGHPLEDPKVLSTLRGDLVGVVANVVDYGFFIRLPFGFDGLLHIDSVPENYCLTKGDVVKVRMKDLDTERKRLSLSIVDGSSSDCFSHAS